MVRAMLIPLVGLAAAGITMVSFKSLFGRKDKKFVCQNCGADVDVKAKSCPKCHIMFEEGGFQCPHCKTAVTATDKVCPSCGEAFDMMTDYACPECGAMVKANTKRCPDCGAKFWSPVRPSDPGGSPVRA